MLEGLEQIQTQIFFMPFFLTVISDNYLLAGPTRTFGSKPSLSPQVTQDHDFVSDLCLPYHMFPKLVTPTLVLASV